MTCKIERYGPGAPKGKLPGELKAMTFSCDHEGCPIVLDSEDIVWRGGLTAMGWECTGGKHYCPDHRLTPAPSIQAITAERRRQIAIEGWTPEHDSAYIHGELARAAACYAIGGRPPGLWPWDEKWWKPGTAERNLEKAGALIAAEIDRINAAAGEGNG